MLRRFVVLALSRYLGSTAKALALLSAYTMGRRMVGKVVGRQPRVERLAVNVGDHIVIDHLPISHKRQIRQFKAARRLPPPGGPEAASR
jgi:hypothetical protein